jgi:hypothetical protein
MGREICIIIVIIAMKLYGLRVIRIRPQDVWVNVCRVLNQNALIADSTFAIGKSVIKPSWSIIKNHGLSSK